VELTATRFLHLHEWKYLTTTYRSRAYAAPHDQQLMIELL
jgi:hypothetical protein